MARSGPRTVYIGVQLGSPVAGSPVPMSQIRFGDFDGNGRPDLIVFHILDPAEVEFGFTDAQPWLKTQLVRHAAA